MLADVATKAFLGRGRAFVMCDADTVLLKVRQVGGAACHEGYHSCFFRQVEGGQPRVIAERVFDPKKVYAK